MQYILTQAEMDQNRRNAEMIQKLPGSYGHTALLEAECKRLATTMIPHGGANLKPHGCVHVHVDNDVTKPTARYCSRCPVEEICPMPKRWSK